jgi:hypothetical protein
MFREKYTKQNFIQAIRHPIPDQSSPTRSHSPTTRPPFTLYSLSGQRMPVGKRGVVIANGKKWLMK